MRSHAFGRRVPTAFAQAIALPTTHLAVVADWDVDAVLSLLFGTKGRVSRTQYRRARLGVVGSYGIIAMLAQAAVVTADPWCLLTEMVAVLVALGLVAWCDVVVTIKRWHDLDKPAVWALLGLVPVAGWIGQSLVCAFKNGTAGANRFGPSAG